MTFETVIYELRKRAEAEAEERQRDDHSQFRPYVPIITEADVEKWHAAAELHRSELYNQIAIWLARGFHRRELSFEFCDAIVNDLHAIITLANEDRPELFWEVFLAFDSGEFYPNNDRSKSPVEIYTRPLIAKVVETYASRYPEIS
jgi:hypothetical protein